MAAFVYILRLASGRLYVGSTRDVRTRWREHLTGRACRTTRVDAPTKLLFTEQHKTFSAARRREHQIKRWTRAKKEALAMGDMDQLRRLARRIRR